MYLVVKHQARCYGGGLARGEWRLAVSKARDSSEFDVRFRKSRFLKTEKAARRKAVKVVFRALRSGRSIFI